MISLGVIASHGIPSFQHLVNRALPHVDEIVVALDKGNCEEGLGGYLDDKVVYFERPLAHNFAAQRNAVIDVATSEWLLFLDTDEDLGDWLWQQVQGLTKWGEDLILFPRATYIQGISRHPTDYLGWPDWQPRLHKRHIRWDRPVHEWPVNQTVEFRLPAEMPYAILHSKTIDDQAKANALYANILAERRAS